MELNDDWLSWPPEALDGFFTSEQESSEDILIVDNEQQYNKENHNEFTAFIF